MGNNTPLCCGKMKCFSRRLSRWGNLFVTVPSPISLYSLSFLLILPLPWHSFFCSLLHFVYSHPSIVSMFLFLLFTFLSFLPSQSHLQVSMKANARNDCITLHNDLPDIFKYSFPYFSFGQPCEMSLYFVLLWQILNTGPNNWIIWIICSTSSKQVSEPLL